MLNCVVKNSFLQKFTKEREITDGPVIAKVATLWVASLEQRVCGGCLDSFGGRFLIAGCYLAETLEDDFKEHERRGSRTPEDDFIFIMAALTLSSGVTIKDCNSRSRGVVTELSLSR